MLSLTLWNQTKSLQPRPSNCQSINTFLLRCTLTAWFCAKVVSYKLWIADRLFPIISPFDIASSFPFWFHKLLLVFSILTMLLLFVWPNKRRFIYMLFASELFSCMSDQMRWQPWEYQYIITLLVFLVNKHRPERVIYMMQLILAATYFYSGIQKVNPAFVPVFWEGMILKNLLQVQPEVLKLPAIVVTGHSMPWIEALGGLLLLFNKTNKTGALLLIIMHIVILLVIGPQALNYNKVVWSWNILMICFLYLIFLHHKESNMRLTLILSPSLNLPIIILWAVMPVLNFVNLWPNYLSFSLYSCKSKEMIVCINKDQLAVSDLSKYFEKDDSRFSFDESMKIIKINNWALDEMSVPPYPEESSYRKFILLFKKRYPNCDARFYQYNIPYSIKGLKELR